MKCTCGHKSIEHGSDYACFYCSCRRFMNAETKPGTCGICGCTESLACKGGCSWINEDRTICSRHEEAA